MNAENSLNPKFQAAFKAVLFLGSTHYPYLPFTKLLSNVLSIVFLFAKVVFLYCQIQGGTNMRIILNLLWKTNKVGIVTLLFISILNSSIFILELGAQERFFAQISKNQIVPSSILFFLIIWLIFKLLKKLMDPIENLLRNKIEFKVKTTINELNIEKILRLKYRYFESGSELDLVNRTITEFDSRIVNLIFSTFKVFSYLLFMLVLTYVLISINLKLAILTIMLIIPIIIISIINGRKFQNVWRITAPYRRIIDYYRSVLTNREYAKEKLLFNYSDYIIKVWETAFEKFRKFSVKEELKASIRVTISTGISFVFMFILMFFSYLEMKNGRLTFSFVAVYVTMLPSIFINVSEQMATGVNNMTRSFLAIRDFEMFYNMEDDEKENSNDICSFKEIEFKNVFFKYPKSDNYILENLNLKIKYGCTYAIVGENGVGKSTIVKLLLRLFEVTEGKILIDGKDIKEISHENLYIMFSVLFQDFAKYPLTVSENLNCNDDSYIHISELFDMEKLVANLPLGLDTVLSSEFENGVDLSGGQWQKIGYVRTINRKSDLIILDEPSSALDPMAESDMYKAFARIIADKTAIFITHRLGATAIVDKILVIHDKRLVESGSHIELMHLNSYYAKMYNAQSKLYASGGKSDVW